jgi:hypothetical protein
MPPHIAELENLTLCMLLAPLAAPDVSSTKLGVTIAQLIVDAIG